MSSTSFDNRDGVMWYDGKFVDWPDAKLHVLSHGLHYASAVFEGTRVYGGNIFRLKEHTDRLLNSAKVLGFQIPYTPEQLNQAQRDLIKRQGIADGYIRPIAWRGSEMMAVSAQNTSIHVAIATWTWPSYFSVEAKLKGIRLDNAIYRRPDPACAPTNAKAAGLYMICTLSKHAAEARGYHDAMMLDYRGLVAEATGANVFFSKEGKLHTPTPDCFLDGITRRTVIDLAKRRGIEVIERHIRPEEMSEFEECFLTGTAAEVTPVSEIGDYRFKPGQLTEALVRDYDAEVHTAPAEAVAV
ncbi:MAG TPA: branched-chain amino acid aminotransferase [Alphaproteobacteria bacterium]|nr:branched-chain amino acid aminotransferase [Alphaproteobacteria bacterium]